MRRDLPSSFDPGVEPKPESFFCLFRLFRAPHRSNQGCPFVVFVLTVGPSQLFGYSFSSRENPDDEMNVTSAKIASAMRPAL